MEFVLHERGDFRSRGKQELVGLERVTGPEDIELLEALISRQEELTDSSPARDILADWRHYLPMLWKVALKFAIAEEGGMTVERHLRAVRRMRAGAAATS